MKTMGLVLSIAAGGLGLQLATSALGTGAEEDIGFEIAPVDATIAFDPQAADDYPVLEFEFTVTNRGSEPKLFPVGPEAMAPVPLANWYIYGNGQLFGGRGEAESPPRPTAGQKLEKLEPGGSFSGSVKYTLLPRKRGTLIARPVEDPSKPAVFALSKGNRVDLAFLYRSFPSGKGNADQRWTGFAFSEFFNMAVDGENGETPSVVSVTSVSNPDLGFSLGVDLMEAVAPPPGKTSRPARKYVPREYTLSNRSGAPMNVILEYASLVPFLISEDGRPVDLYSGADHYRQIVSEDVVRLEAGKSVTHEIQIGAYHSPDKSTGGFSYANCSGMHHGAQLEPGRYFLVFRYSPPKAVDDDDWGKSPSGKPAPKEWWKGTLFSHVIEFKFSNSEEVDES